MSVSSPATSDPPADAVELVLGADAAAVRRATLEEVGPELEALIHDLPEEEELSPAVWETLAAADGRYLDARAREHGSAAVLGISRLAVASEALATRRQTFMMPVLLTALPSVTLLLHGDPGKQDRYVKPLREGRARAAFALSERGAGSDVAATATVATPDGADYVITGEKSWVSAAPAPDWIVVFARVASHSAARPRLSCFVVERAAPGVSLAPAAGTLGMRSVPLWDVFLDRVRVPAEQQVGGEGDGFKIAMRTLNAIRPLVAARGLGLTASVIMAATRWTEQRRAFGGSLIDLQLVRAKLADLAARLEAARLLTYRAAALVDHGCVGKEHAPLLAAAKLVATELAVEAAGTCLHVCGAAGYTEDLPFARALRDAQQLTIVEGVSEVQLELVARGLADRTLWWDEAVA